MKILPKIDIHAHTNPDTLLYHEWGRMATPDELRAIYDEYGIEKSLLLPSIEEITMREARDIVKQYAHVFGWWTCNLDPMMGYNDPDRDLTPTLSCYKDAGAKGVGELTVNYYFDDPVMLNLFGTAEKLGMFVLFHMGNKGRDYGVVDEIGMPRLEKVLKMFPKLRVLGHSQKFWAEISGDVTPENRNGYPTGPVAPGGRLPELLRRYPNLCCDLSAGSGCNAITRDPDFGYAFLEEFQDRCYFGTDICERRNLGMLKLITFLDEGMQNGRLSYAAYEKISRGNALDLLEG